MPGGIGILISPHAYNEISSVYKITHRIMIMNFHRNTQTTVISCYSPTNVSEDKKTNYFIQISRL